MIIAAPTTNTAAPMQPITLLFDIALPLLW
jgi:hypothetical protein